MGFFTRDVACPYCGDPGATKSLFDESAWESVSARVMIESERPVLVVPSPDRGNGLASDGDYVRPDAEAEPG